jgi:beta-lactamase superfamily II metal-dependent hydrolase
LRTEELKAMAKKPVRTDRAAVAKTAKSPSKRGSQPSVLAPGPATQTSLRAVAAGPRATIRVYRHGLGDCILIKLKRTTGIDFKILIDCGVAMATQDAPVMMTKVLEDVAHETDGKIDVLAVTHEHWDHVSGFSQAEEAFKRLTVGEVWVAWTEDPADELAKSLRQDHAAAVNAVGASAQAMAVAGRADRAQDVLNVLGLLGAAGEKTKVAFDIAKNANGKKPRYWQPDRDPPFQVPDSDIRIYALGPPHDATLIRKILPSKSNPETYALALDGRGIFPIGVASALAFSDEHDPFADTRMIPIEQARGMPFFQNHYWGAVGESAQWQRIDAEWLGAADDLALALQSATNNTSLVLAIELSGGDVLLFVGDAQVGNWLSWQQLKWPQDTPTVTGPNLLARTIFYKVGHHGSHNATLRAQGLEQMSNLHTAVIPVDHDVAVKMRWGAMPLETLVTALKEKTNGRALQTDKKMTPPQPLDGVTVTDLYYEVAV